MKKISVNIGAQVREIALTDAQSKRVEDALIHAYGYKAKIANPEPRGEDDKDYVEEIDNPQKVDEFVKDVIKKFLVEHVQAHEAQKARQEAVNNLTKFTI
jgi:hypothetical protein